MMFDLYLPSLLLMLYPVVAIKPHYISHMSLSFVIARIFCETISSFSVILLASLEISLVLSCQGSNKMVAAKLW